MAKQLVTSSSPRARHLESVLEFILSATPNELDTIDRALYARATVFIDKELAEKVDQNNEKHKAEI